MKAIKYLSISLFFVITGLLSSCDKQQDYSDIVYKNYLGYEIDRAASFLVTVSEGNAEGQYQTGSMQAYQDVIDESSVVYTDEFASQTEIDEAYTRLLTADLDFYNRMNPFVSRTMIIIDYAEYVYSTTDEGSHEGNVPEGSKADLRLVIDSAGRTVIRTDLTQTMLDIVDVHLYNALAIFNSGIIGKATINLTNPGFELPGYETEDFAEVPGWGLYGVIEEWMYSAGVSLCDTAPEGDYIARFGTYTTGIYQQLPELAQTNSTYDLTMTVSLLSNNTDWQGDRYPAILLSRFLVFEGSAGNYNFVRVLSEQYDTLGLHPTSFYELNHRFEVDNNGTYEGQKIAIDLILRHTWNTQEPIYAESYVGIDNLQITRE